MKTSVRRAALLLLVCALFLTAALPAFATQERTVQHASNCASPSTRTRTVTTYKYVNYTTHTVITSLQQDCPSCGVIFSSVVQSEQSVTHTRASSGSFVPGVHTGNYKTHYYIYESTCTFCAGHYRFNKVADCTASGCVNPASLPSQPVTA